MTHKPRPYTEEDIATLHRMKAAGHTPDQIARAINRTPGSVRDFAMKAGNPWRKVPGTSGLFAGGKPIGSDWDGRVAQREADARFVRALAEAFQRGDHLPERRAA